MGDERIGIALLVGVDDHAGLFVGQQDVLVLVHDGQARRLNFLIGFLFGRGFKKFIVDV